LANGWLRVFASAQPEQRELSRSRGADTFLSMEPRMIELILGQLARILVRLPREVSMNSFLWDADEREPIMRSDWEIAVAYAWLEGVADAEDVTVTQIVEEAELSEA
jgi:hypothetical protein